MEFESNANSAMVFNRDEMLDRCVGKVELLQRILNKFEQRFDDDLKQLLNELRSVNAEGVALVAHRVKGACSSVAACQLTDRMTEIERLARAGCLDAIPAEISILEDDWKRFCQHAYAHEMDGSERQMDE